MLKMNRGSGPVPRVQATELPPRPSASRRILALTGLAFVFGVVMAGAVLWATSATHGELPMGWAPLIAALIGGGGAMAIGVGLMALLFHSNRSGWDDHSG